MRSTTCAALLCAAMASGAAAQQSAAPAIRFDGQPGGPAAGGILQQAYERRGEAPPVGQARELSVDWNIEIGIGDPSGRYDGGGYSWRWERVNALAHEAEESARRLHRAAENRGHHGDHWEERFLRACHRFEQQASHFHRQVESYRQNPSHTRSDYYQVVNAFREVEWTIRSGHVDGRVWSDFYSAQSAINQLDYYYRSGGYDPGHGDHDDRDEHGDWPFPGRPRYPRGGHGRRPHGW